MEKAANIATLNENHPQTVEHLMRMADNDADENCSRS